MNNAVPVALLTSIHNANNSADMTLLFNLTSLRQKMNATPVALQFDLTSLGNVGNAADTALLFNYCMNKRNISFFVVC